MHKHAAACIVDGRLVCGYGTSGISRVISADFLRVADQLSRHLGECGIRHALAGGLAVSSYGYDRTTKDIDLIVSPKDVAKLKAALGHMTTSHMADGPRDVSKAVFLGADVDLLHTRKNERLLDSELKLEGVPIVSLGALMYLKMLASRAKDFADVVELLKADPDAGSAAKGFLLAEQLSGEVRQKLSRKLGRARVTAKQERDRS